MIDAKAKTATLATRPQEWSDRAQVFWYDEEDALLEAAGFEPEEGGNLWTKGSVCYGRNAALQSARRG